MPLYSMTGYGQARSTTDFGEFEVSFKSVNNRFLELNIRLPRELAPLELDLRDFMKTDLLRGKVDCSITFIPSENLGKKLKIDRALLNAYRKEIQALQAEWDVEEALPWRELLTLSGAVSVEAQAVEPERMLEPLKETISEALKAFWAHREREGAALREELATRIDALERHVETVDTGRGEVVEQYRERLHQRVAELRERLPDTIDDARLEGEVLLFAEKADITEEIVRLRAHFEEARRQFDADAKEAGKTLEFLNQEMLREVNTIGSKARKTEINSAVVEMKSILEKVREQVMNVL